MPEAPDGGMGGFQIQTTKRSNPHVSARIRSLKLLERDDP